MRLLIQRVSSASVSVQGRTVGNIGQGLVILAGFSHLDDRAAAGRMADKAVNLRIFEDSQGRMNLSLLDVKGQVLLVSQFTLYADCRRGRRPSFTEAAPPGKAEELYTRLIQCFKDLGVELHSGVFGASMLVNISNEGPVTVMLDSEEGNGPDVLS
jgi:D-tyrosyl-tRNA(Tyr) deacylase